MLNPSSLSSWSPFFKVYDPLKAGSIDGTDTVPHDNAVIRAICAEYIPPDKRVTTSDPQHTLFVGRLNLRTTDSQLEKEFSQYGDVKSCHLVRDIVTGSSRGYAFVEFKWREDAERAWRRAHGTFFHDRQLLVEWEFARTMPGWIPRRLGGGLGGRKESGQLRFGGRDRPFRKPLLLPQDRSDVCAEQSNLPSQIGDSDQDQTKGEESFYHHAEQRSVLKRSNKYYDRGEKGENKRSFESKERTEKSRYYGEGSNTYWKQKAGNQDSYVPRDNYHHRNRRDGRESQAKKRSFTEEENNYFYQRETDYRSRSRTKYQGKEGKDYFYQRDECSRYESFSKYEADERNSSSHLESSSSLFKSKSTNIEGNTSKDKCSRFDEATIKAVDCSEVHSNRKYKKIAKTEYHSTHTETKGSSNYPHKKHKKRHIVSDSSQSDSSGDGRTSKKHKKSKKNKSKKKKSKKRRRHSEDELSE